MKILLVSWSVLPRSGGSSIIVESLSKNFARNELIVLGGKGVVAKSIYHRPNGSPRFIYFPSEINMLGRGARFFEGIRSLLFPLLVQKIERVIAEQQIQHVIGVFPDAFYCLAASKAARKTNTPFSSYFHNTYIENSAIKHPRAADIQAEIFEHSRHIFVMSDGMKRFYEEKYRLNKFIPLVHTFDQWPEKDTYSGIPEKKEVYKLVAIGNFNQSNLDASRRFLSAIADSDKYNLSIYTPVPKMLLASRGLDSSLYQYFNSVIPDKVHQVLQQYDICVLTHGFDGSYGDVEYKTIFPTRTIPLLLSGKPIIAHSPKDSYLNEFLSKYQCAEIVDEPDEYKILQALDKIADDPIYQVRLVRNALKAATNFQLSSVVNKMLTQLDVR